MSDYIAYFNKLSKKAKICLGIILLAIILPPVFSIESRQDVYLPEYAAFSTRNRKPQVILQTFDDPKVVCLNWFHDSGRSYSLYCTVKNGNKMYDSGGSKCGYLIVKGDGSIVIKGWSEANGHYYGVDGEKASKK